jgi:hypothetical protein
MVLPDMAQDRTKVPTYRAPSEPYRPPVERLEHAVGILRRRYGRGLNRFPTADERGAMWRAARLRCIADHAISDPACDANTQVRLINAADRAETRMRSLLERNTPDAFGPDSLRQYAAAMNYGRLPEQPKPKPTTLGDLYDEDMAHEP